jgi:NADPH-dependent ferric siderophore reductase
MGKDVKAFLGKVLGPLVFREAMVTSVTDVSPLVRCVRLEHASLAGIACSPGDKLQVFLANAGMRTYTPVGWDASRGAFELLVYLRSGRATPGVEWARALVPGQGVQFFGPRKSVRISSQAPEATGLVLFGDETSLGVARALGASRPEIRVVLEVDDPAAVEHALGDMRERVVLVPRDGERHFDIVVNTIRTGFAAGARPELALTGAAPSIQAVQKRLKAAGIRASSSKAYWAPGKVGLD